MISEKREVPAPFLPPFLPASLWFLRAERAAAEVVVVVQGGAFVPRHVLLPSWGYPGGHLGQVMDTKQPKGVANKRPMGGVMFSCFP